MKTLIALLSSALLFFILPTRVWAVEFKEINVSASNVATIKNGSIENDDVSSIGNLNNSKTQDLLIFENLDIPKGSFILEATVQLTLNKFFGRTVKPKISVDQFSHSLPQDYKEFLNMRSGLINSVLWTNIPKGLPGTKLESPDISELIQSLVIEQDWNEKNYFLISIEDFYSDIDSGLEYFANNTNFRPQLKIKFASPQVIPSITSKQGPVFPTLNPTPTPVNLITKHVFSSEPSTTPPTINPMRTMIASRISKGGNSDTTVANSQFSATNSIQSFGKDSNGSIENAILFDDIQVEKGKKIKSAYISFTISASTGGDVSVIVSAQNNSLATSPLNIDDYENLKSNLTVSRISWNKIPDGKWGTNITTPNLADILQEVVDQVSWAKGNPILFYFADNNSDEWSDRTFLTGDFEGTDGKPTLVIEFEEEQITPVPTVETSSSSIEKQIDLSSILTPILKEE